MNYPHDYDQGPTTTVDEPGAVDEQSDQPQARAAEDLGADAGSPDEVIIVAEPEDEAGADLEDEAGADPEDEADADLEDEDDADPEDEADAIAEPESALVTHSEGDVVAEPDDDVVVAEVIQVDEVDHLAAAYATGRAADYGSGAEWHNIQATFVDDPRGAVQLAADAAESAISALASRVRDSRSALTSANSDSPNQDTERLRFALQQYRQLGQTVDGLVQAMPQG